MSEFRTQTTARGMDEASFMLGAATQQLGTFEAPLSCRCGLVSFYHQSDTILLEW